MTCDVAVPVGIPDFIVTFHPDKSVHPENAPPACIVSPFQAEEEVILWTYTFVSLFPKRFNPIWESVPADDPISIRHVDSEEEGFQNLPSVVLVPSEVQDDVGL